jgi:hypothetical protein
LRGDDGTGAGGRRYRLRAGWRRVIFAAYHPPAAAVAATSLPYRRGYPMDTITTRNDLKSNAKKVSI